MAKLRTSAFARRAGISERVARMYGDKGLIPCERDSTGGRLFDDRHVVRARTLFEKRTARNRVGAVNE
jgi:DNA-binding transcriptional MerR regulator